MTETNSSCEWCGAPMAPGSKFCSACGQAPSSKDSESPTEVSAESWSMLEPLPFSEPEPESTDRWGSPLPIEEPDSPDRWGSPQTSDSQPSEPQLQTAIPGVPVQPEKKNRKWILFVVLGLIVICACLAIAAVGGFALFSGDIVSGY